MNILFIGNSYTYYNEMPKIFEALAKENGFEISVDSVTKGGRKLYENLDPCDENHRLIRSLCDSKAYDVLFLQENSTLPLRDSKAFMQGAKELALLIGAKKNILYATWGRKNGSPTLSELGISSEEMTDTVHEQYLLVAKNLGMDISPVGLSFKYLSSALPIIDLYSSDLSHPSYLGSCVAALTHYYTLFGCEPKHYSSLSIEPQTVKSIIDTVKVI